MGKIWKKFWSFHFWGNTFSPAGFLARALLIAIVFGALELAGLRGYTMIISGTSPTADANDQWALILGCLYLFFYTAFVVLTPILILAAAIFHLLIFRSGKSCVAGK